MKFPLIAAVMITAFFGVVYPMKLEFSDKDFLNAVKAKNLEAVKNYLTNQEFDITKITKKEEFNVVCVATMHDSYECLELILNTLLEKHLEQAHSIICAPSPDLDKWTPLQYAVNFEYTKCAELLRKAEKQAKHGVTTVKKLLEQWTSNTQDFAEITKALCVAAEYGNEKDVEVLLEKIKKVMGFNAFKIMDACDSEGKTPLMYASTGGSIACVRLLVKAEVDIHAIDRHGNKACMLTTNEDIRNFLCKSRTCACRGTDK